MFIVVLLSGAFLTVGYKTIWLIGDNKDNLELCHNITYTSILS